MLKANPRTWSNDLRCAECCNGDRCDDPDHHDRRSCPYCYGTGWAIWTPAGRADYVAHLTQRGSTPGQAEAAIQAIEQSRICHVAWVRPGGRCAGCGEYYARLRDPAWRSTGWDQAMGEHG
jgi:hypothetical protein